MAFCPKCEADLDLDEEEASEGEMVNCPDCGAGYEIVNAHPLELEAQDDEELEDDDEELDDLDEEEDEDDEDDLDEEEDEDEDDEDADAVEDYE